jgi:DNA gyrase subunit A
MAKERISDRQTDAIPELRLYQLTNREQNKINKEYADLMKVIAAYHHSLNDEQLHLGVVHQELVAIREL